MPERKVSALLHWINPPDVRSLFYAGSVTTPPDVDGFVALCNEARNRLIPNVKLAGVGGTMPLPPELTEREQQLRATEQFKSAYEPYGAVFASVPIADLLVPQVWADAAYADELAQSLPASGDEIGLFDFCFAYGRLEPPMLLGLNGAVVVSGRRSLGTVSPLRVATATESKVTFEFDVLPRPNWLWLNVIPQTQQILVLNGIHHLLALLMGGRERAYCLLRQGPIEQVLSVDRDPGLFKTERIISARPPLLRDYLDHEVRDDIALRAVDQFMRVMVSNPPDFGFVPQSEA